ncbi:hypothetical protein [Phaffia rhodozyma]|uniref:Uncharacterized protein n=1 Tax=Phaffia rhodozyma TaxID=264483 RepID=A0A0F7SG55_PHARH|nr:hypothetical protein [Phaffia rhodozyma]
MLTGGRLQKKSTRGTENPYPDRHVIPYTGPFFEPPTERPLLLAPQSQTTKDHQSLASMAHPPTSYNQKYNAVPATSHSRSRSAGLVYGGIGESPVSRHSSDINSNRSGSFTTTRGKIKEGILASLRDIQSFGSGSGGDDGPESVISHGISSISSPIIPPPEEDFDHRTRTGTPHGYRIWITPGQESYAYAPEAHPVTTSSSSSREYSPDFFIPLSFPHPDQQFSPYMFISDPMSPAKPDSKFIPTRSAPPPIAPVFERPLPAKVFSKAHITPPLQPALPFSHQHPRLRPSGAGSLKSISVPNLRSTAAQQASSSEISNTSDRRVEAYQAAGTCSSFTFPKPKLQPFLITPPTSPNVSQVLTDSTSSHALAQKRLARKPVLREDVDLDLQKVRSTDEAADVKALRECAARDKERNEWAQLARKRGMSRSITSVGGILTRTKSASRRDRKDSGIGSSVRTGSIDILRTPREKEEWSKGGSEEEEARRPRNGRVIHVARSIPLFDPPSVPPPLPPVNAPNFTLPNPPDSTDLAAFRPPITDTNSYITPSARLEEIGLAISPTESSFSLTSSQNPISVEYGKTTRRPSINSQPRSSLQAWYRRFPPPGASPTAESPSSTSSAPGIAGSNSNVPRESWQKHLVTRSEPPFAFTPSLLEFTQAEDVDNGEDNQKASFSADEERDQERPVLGPRLSTRTVAQRLANSSPEKNLRVVEGMFFKPISPNQSTGSLQSNESASSSPDLQKNSPVDDDSIGRARSSLSTLFTMKGRGNQSHQSIVPLGAAIMNNSDESRPTLHRVDSLRSRALVCRRLSRHSLRAELGEPDDASQEILSPTMMDAFPTPPPSLLHKDSYTSQSSYTTARPSIRPTPSSASVFDWAGLADVETGDSRFTNTGTGIGLGMGMGTDVYQGRVSTEQSSLEIPPLQSWESFTSEASFVTAQQN